MNWVSVLSLLFGSGLLTAVVRYLIGRIKANDRRTEAVGLGVQALLRDRLLSTYNHYERKGYAPIYAKENFENMWKQYHNLGVNGVMDNLHEKFMDLPEREVAENED